MVWRNKQIFFLISTAQSFLQGVGHNLLISLESNWAFQWEDSLPFNRLASCLNVSCNYVSSCNFRSHVIQDDNMASVCDLTNQAMTPKFGVKEWRYQKGDYRLSQLNKIKPKTEFSKNRHQKFMGSYYSLLIIIYYSYFVYIS